MKSESNWRIFEKNNAELFRYCLRHLYSVTLAEFLVLKNGLIIKVIDN